jgi:predicted transposase/invertase (TIGR01784 family)
MRWSKEELEAYDARGIYIQDERGRIEYALEEGKREGKIETAKELLMMGIEPGKIARATGLKKEEIEKLTSPS